MLFTPCVSKQVGRVYPQAVYFPIRTLYLTLKIEQRERYKSGMSWAGLAGQTVKGSVRGGALCPDGCGHSPALCLSLAHGKTLWGWEVRVRFLKEVSGSPWL